MPIDPGTLSGKRLWLRGKDLAGADASTVTAWADQSGTSHSPLSFSGTTVKTAASPSGGRVARLAIAAIPLPELFAIRSNELTATASSEFSPSFSAANAVDGTSAAWAAADSALSLGPVWLRVQQATPVAATSYQILCRTGWDSHAPKDWKFQGSSDGSSWTDLDTRSGQTFVTGTERTFTLSNSTAYTYYRLLISASGDGAGPDIDNFGLNGVSNVATASPAEVWIVAKSNDTSGGAWMFGNSGQQNHFTFIGTCYSDFGNGSRRSYTPSPSIASTWRLFRFSIDSSGNLREYIDETLNLSVNSLTRAWRADPHLSYSWTGDIAEVFARTTISSSGEVADLITYFNTEHGLSVPGGSAAPDIEGVIAAVSDSQGTLAANSLLSGQVDAASTVEGDLTTNLALAGQVNAISGAQGSLGGTTSLAFDFSAKADLTVALTTITLGLLSFDFKTKASLTLGAPLTVTTMALDFAAKPDLNAAFARRHTVDPVTGLPQYRLVAVQADGTRLAELPRAAIGDLTEEIGLDGTKLDFTLPKYDATNAFVLPVKGEQIREVQVWRGPNLETWQRVDGARPDAQTIDYDCSGLGGYLDDRMIGKFPKTDLLVNGSFALGDYGWSYTNEPMSIPASPPNHSIVTVDFFGTKAKALQLTGADKIETHTQSLETAAVFVPNSASFLAGGAAKITAEAHDIPAGTTNIVIEGHTAYAYIDGDYGDGLALSLARANAAKPLVQAVHPAATITTVGKGRFKPVASNDTHAGQAKNRRVEFHYTSTVTAAASSAQYAKGSLTSGTITVPTATKRAVPVTFKGWANLTSYLAASQHGYGVYLQIVKQSAPSVVVDSAYSQLDETTPVGVWERHEATVTVPADGQTYLFDVRFYAPGGVVQWTQGGVYPEEALHFPDDDQALIAKGIIEHVQDPAMGKLGDTPILIGTRTPLTGTKRTKTYSYHERRTASDALGELGSMHGGMDMRVGFDETTRWVETHYPRLGNTVPVTIALGSNVIAYDAPTDATAAGTRWIAQALESSGADREEGMAEDLSGLGGMLVERLAYSEPGTAVTELTQTAVASLKRNGHPIAALEVTIGLVTGSIAAQVELTNYMLDRVKVGDVVDVEIIDGPIVILGPHRVIRRRLTPATDQLRYSLAPEV